MADLTAFADAWIRDWNAHDLEAVLSHYSEDVRFHSPKIVGFTNGETDCLDGREALRPYFARGLMSRPELTFTLLETYRDRSGVALVYRAEDGRTACETMVLDASDRASQVRVFYKESI